jgi:CheY-like chemotaxis protein
MAHDVRVQSVSVSAEMPDLVQPSTDAGVWRLLARWDRTFQKFHERASEVVVCRDGQEALDYLFSRGKFSDCVNESPAVILLDLKLPKVDGLEVLQKIKSDERLRMIPVVRLTSSMRKRGMMRSYKLGVNAYVVKPIDFHEFINAGKALGMFWAAINVPPPATA